MEHVFSKCLKIFKDLCLLVCFVDAFDRRMSNPKLDAAKKSWDMQKQKLVAMLGTKKTCTHSAF